MGMNGSGLECTAEDINASAQDEMNTVGDILFYNDSSPCKGEKSKSNIYKYDKVGKTDTLQMSPRPAATTLCRVATLVCPCRST